MNLKAFVASRRILGVLMLGGISFAIVVPGEAKAVSCLLSDLASCNQVIGDRTYSNFGFSGFTPNGADSFSVTSGSVSLNFSPDRTADIAAGQFTYTVTLAGGNFFNKAQSNLTGSTLGGGSYSTSLAATGLTSPATSSGGAGAVQSFGSSVSTAVFTQNFSFDYNANPDTLSSVGGSFTTFADTPSVPGPLPVLGAGAAFGFSRKLRQRIKQSA
jgi:hypothetical protein